jgi:hypothetical protein
MAQLLPIPTNVPEAVSTGYQRQNTNFNAVTAGHINLGIKNINESSAPVIAGGSVVEVNGGIYRASGDESVTDASSADGLSPPAAGVNYIYAVHGTSSSLSWKYSSSAPAWNTLKGGWYNGNNRAVAKLFISGTQYNGKIILDSYNAMQQLNTEQAAPDTGGVQVVTGVVNQVKSTIFQPGAYRYEIKAGSGGNGGNTGRGSGGVGTSGQSATGSFMLRESRVIYYALGGDGNNGQDRYAGQNGGGGGGGCTGGSSFIDLIDRVIICIGGSGGGGMASIGNGGGGGGGYGTGSNGDGIEQYSGKGGSNGYGGNGGNGGDASGGGGSGIYGGGVGSEAGGGYGLAGGKGGDDGGDSGGAGGKSTSGEGGLTATQKYNRQIQYQGGGGGGAGSNEPGGNGGSGLKSASSGYLNIYQVW